MPSPLLCHWGRASYSFWYWVNHVAWEVADEYVSVMEEKDLQPGKSNRVDVDGILAVCQGWCNIPQLLRLVRISQVP